ncbi:MAG: GNAT family N-acetyltransferase [Chloroflexota bacterium]
MYGPIIEGEHIRLEPPKAAYAATYIQWFADPQLTCYSNPPSLRQEAEWLEQMADSTNDIVWAIVLRENGKLIGNIGLQHIEWRHRHSHSGTIIGDPTQWAKAMLPRQFVYVPPTRFVSWGLKKYSHR